MSKPTEDLSWAETPPAPGDVLEPTTVRGGGYPLGAPLPYNHVNWLLRALGRTAAWVRTRFGDDGEMTLGAANGGIELTEDSGDPIDGPHIYTHKAKAAGVTSEFRSDAFGARRGLLYMGGEGSAYPDELLTTPQGMVKAAGAARFESDGSSGVPSFFGGEAGYNIDAYTLNAAANRLEVTLVRPVPASAWGDTVLVTASPVRTGAMGSPLAPPIARRVIFTAEPVLAGGDVVAVHIYGTYISVGGTELDFFTGWATADTATQSCFVNFALI